MPMYRKVNKDFFKKWTREMAYVLGFFAADGYITVNKRGGQFWSIQIVDKDLLQKIREVVGSEHKISISRRTKTFSGRTSIYTAYRLQIGSVEMCNDLRKLGMRENKTRSLSVPDVPNKYFSDFVRGYFDGDGGVWMGYIHKERRTKFLDLRSIFTSCSKQFLFIMKQRLCDFGIEGGVSRKEKGNYYRLTYSVKGSLKLSNFMYNHMGKLPEGLFLKRKKKIFEKYVKMQS